MYEEKICRVWPNVELSERAKCTREYVLRQFRQSFVENGFDLVNAIQTKTLFSSAIAVMDKIGGWKEKDWVGSRFAARIWDLHENSDIQRSKEHARLRAATI